MGISVPVTDLPEEIRKKVPAEDLPNTPVQTEKSIVNDKPIDALKSFGSSVYGGVKGLADIILATQDPNKAYELATGIYNAHADQALKSMNSFKQGNVSEGIGHGLAAAIPMVGPAAAHAGEEIGKGNIYGGLGETTALIAPNILSPLISKVIPKSKISSGLENSAKGNMVSTLLPGSKNQVPLAETTAEGLVNRKPIALTREQFQNLAKAKKAEYGPQASTAWDSASPVNLQNIFDKLEELKTKKVNVKGTDVPANENLSKLIDDYQEKLIMLEDQKNKGYINAATLDDFADKMNQGLVNSKGDFQYQTAPQSLKMIQKSTARSIRDVLDGPNPTAAAINANYHLWADTAKFLEDARRSMVASKSSIVTGSSKGFGAMVQKMLPRPVREIPARITGIFDSVAWNTTSSAFKKTVADAIAVGKFDMAYELMKNSAKLRTSTEFSNEGQK
jgi:hypothetical protein